MKITGIDIYIYKLDQHYRLRGLEDTPGRFPGTDYFIEPLWRQAYSRKVESCLLKVRTDTGISGWGEAQAPLLPETPGSILKHLVGPFLIGQNPLRREWAQDQLYHMMNVRGHGSGFMLDAIAGVDMALWDIAGKHYGAPVYELMGGPFATELTAYVSGLRQPTLEAQCAAAEKYMDEGYAGIKLFLGHGVEKDVQTIREVRRAAGPKARLLCDLLWRYGVADALRVGRALEREAYDCLEAPVAPEDLAGHRRLVQALDVPIAVGEALRSVYEFLPWFQQGALEIVQPDVMRTGLTSARKIAAMAEARRMPVAPHVGVCTGIGMAATWQFAASIPNFWIQEYQLELARNSHLILKTPLETKDGRLVAPSRPGLGVEVDESAVAGLSTDHWRVGEAEP